MLRTFITSKSHFLKTIATILLILPFLKEYYKHFKNNTWLEIATMEEARQNIKIMPYYCLKARNGVSEITKFKCTNFLNCPQVSKNILHMIIKSNTF